MADIFISYRRTQTFVVDRIRERILATFRRASLFLDRPDIKPGTKFPQEIENALASARIVLVIIGPTWISVQDPVTFERRLTMENDWVRIEVERSLKENKIVIPVLVEGAEMPTRAQLPPSLVDLATRNKVTLHPEYFAEDLNGLLVEMKSQITKRKLQELFDDDSHPYPKSRLLKPAAIKEKDREKMLDDLPRWSIEKSPIEDDTRKGAPTFREEIVRIFKFPTFLAAIDFMSAAAKRIDPYDHHPRWENKFKTVTVALSTWDSGHTISDRDYKTALMLERFYREFIEGLQDGNA